MWQDILVYAILAAAAGVIFWKFCRKLTGKASCCGSACSCSGSCPSGGGLDASGSGEDGLKLAPLSGSPCKRIE